MDGTPITAAPPAADVEVGPVEGEAPRPMRRDALRNRALLLEAAREIFARRGLEASLDDVAKQAGVGVGTAYRHFANKFELAAAVVREAILEIAGEAERAAASDDPWAGLLGFLETVLARQTEDRGLREVMMGVHDPSKSDLVHDSLMAPVTQLLERAKAAGAVRPEVTGTDLGFLIIMLCQVADVGGYEAPGVWRRYLPTMLAALRPGGPELPGEPLSDEQFRAATSAHASCGIRPLST